MMTEQAIYNIAPKKLKTFKRRIHFKDLAACTQTVAKDTHEFVLHINKQHDYRYHSLYRSKLLDCLTKQYDAFMKKPLRRNYAKNTTLRNFVVDRTMGGAAVQKKRTLMTKLDTRPPAELMAEAKDGARGGYTGWSAERASAVDLDHFILTKVIGRGSFGKVYLAKKKTAPKKGAFFALKVLSKKVIFERNQVEHTMAERKVMETITHPFLMTLHYAFQNATRLYFVMDYLPGGELFFHLRKERRFKLDRARFYAAEIALGLGFLHENNIIYRDLKPENILLDAEGHVCLTDFGLAKEDMSKGVTTMTFCGTPEYLAPEIVEGVGHAKEVDWWSLGILLFEMLVGCPPFFHENVQVMYSKIRGDEIPMPTMYLPAPARSIISELLNRDPTERLGCGRAGVESIKKHGFFSAIDWPKLFARQLRPPYIPRVKNGADTQFVSKEFLGEVVKETYEAADPLADGDKEFADFAYQPDGHS